MAFYVMFFGNSSSQHQLLKRDEISAVSEKSRKMNGKTRSCCISCLLRPQNSKPLHKSLSKTSEAPGWGSSGSAFTCSNHWLSFEGCSKGKLMGVWVPNTSLPTYHRRTVKRFVFPGGSNHGWGWKGWVRMRGLGEDERAASQTTRPPCWHLWPILYPYAFRKAQSGQ